MESGNFSASTSSNLVTAFQTQNFKRQIDLLEQKLEINEREYQNKILSLTEQNSLLNSTEVKLRTQLSTKDKALYELNSILKEYISSSSSNNSGRGDFRISFSLALSCRSSNAVF